MHRPPPTEAVAMVAAHVPQACDPLPEPLPPLLLRLVVPFPTSLNKLCHSPLLRPHPVVPLTRGGGSWLRNLMGASR